MSDRRSTVFLEEMGVGPQWRLRNRPGAAGVVDTADPASFAEAAQAPLTQAQAVASHAAPVAQERDQFAPQAAGMPGSPAGAADAFADPAPVIAPQASDISRPAQAAGQQAPAAPQRAPANVQSPAAAAAAAARAASTAPATGTEARQAPPTAPGAPEAPAAPARVPGTPSIASTGEDMSWFDDAPTPEYKPQRKKVAAPEEPSAVQPQRSAPAAPSAPAGHQPMQPRTGGMPQRPASAPPSATGYEAPAYDDIPMDEPPTWFDDDQPGAPAAARAPLAGRVSDEEIARMDWPALQAAIGACTRCGRCETRQQAIPGRGDEQASWIALDTAPGQAEDREGYLFAGDPGYLLDNMLKAVGQTTEKGAYLTGLVKCHAPHAPSAEELQACRPYLERELELTQAKVIVAFGHTTGKGLLGGAARGRIMLHGSVPVVATYHPADLLKKPEEKAKAWQDLCLAKAAHAGRR